MPNKAKPIPKGYHTVTPYLIVDGGVAALDFTEGFRCKGIVPLSNAERKTRARRNEDR